MKKMLYSALASAFVCFLTQPAMSAPDTVASVRARAHIEIAKRDAQIAELKRQIAELKRQVAHLGGRAVHTQSSVRTQDFAASSSLAVQIAKYNQIMRRTQDDLQKVADSEDASKKDGLPTSREGLDAQNNAWTVSGRYLNDAYAQVKLATPLHKRILEAPIFNKSYTEGNICLSSAYLDDAWIKQGVDQYRFFVPSR